MLSRLRTVLHHLNRDKATTVSGTSSLIRTASAAMSSDAPKRADVIDAFAGRDEISIPPVVSDTESYKPKGEFVSFEHTDKEKFAKDPITRAYVTGPTGTGKTIIVIFDIFGFFNQTVQGADLIAETVQAKVIMPDFFRDQPMDIKLYPPTTDDAKKKISTFFQVQGNFGDRIPELLDLVKGEKNNGAQKVGLIGYCWGGKMSVLANATGEFAGTASVHPAMWARADAEKLKAPVAIYPSQDENKEEFDAFMEIANKYPWASENDYKLYDNMFHGWAAARGDLSNADNLKAYEDVYTRLSDFFKNTLA
ncbi:hypothetical protein FRB90_010683 [Tulasnella sp. 427]|nr:hypothetical protein FRB90_010683 [Tulasnella sp. 427]